MRKASEAKFYALTTSTACALALIAVVVSAPVRAVIQDLVFDQYQRWEPRSYAFDQPVRVVDVDEEGGVGLAYHWCSEEEGGEEEASGGLKH